MNGTRAAHLIREQLLRACSESLHAYVAERETSMRPEMLVTAVALITLGLTGQTRAQSSGLMFPDDAPLQKKAPLPRVAPRGAPNDEVSRGLRQQDVQRPSSSREQTLECLRTQNHNVEYLYQGEVYSNGKLRFRLGNWSINDGWVNIRSNSAFLNGRHSFHGKAFVLIATDLCNGVELTVRCTTHIHFWNCTFSEF